MDLAEIVDFAVPVGKGVALYAGGYVCKIGLYYWLPLRKRKRMFFRIALWTPPGLDVVLTTLYALKTPYKEW